MGKFLVLLFLVGASAAYGEIYTWKDARGTDFYTNSLDEIPAKYLKRARVLDVATGKKGGPATAQPAGATATPVAPVPPVPQVAEIPAAPAAASPGEAPHPVATTAPAAPADPVAAVPSAPPAAQRAAAVTRSQPQSFDARAKRKALRRWGRHEDE